QDRVLAEWQDGCWVDGRADSLCLLKRSEEGACEIESLVFVDLGEGIYLPAQSDPVAAKRGVPFIEHGGKRYLFNKRRRLLSVDTIPLDFAALKGGLPAVESDEGLVLINRHYGLFWVFDEKGRFRRRIQLFDQGSDDELCQIDSYWRHERAVLGCQPLRDGALLVATRSLGAVLFARKDLPLLDEQGQPEKPGFFQARQKWSWWDRPAIVWWEVDPNSGTASQIVAPPGAPETMTESIATAGLTWTYDRYGDPVFSPPERGAVVGPEGQLPLAEPVQPVKKAVQD
ncbi:MAG: hypothetical protein P4L11_09065, partial [Geothrix sp.]|nr:hypothetical protein [Geothrix sp.]